MLLIAKNETLYSSSQTATATACEQLTVTSSDAGSHITVDSPENDDCNETQQNTAKSHTNAMVRCLTQLWLQ